MQRADPHAGSAFEQRAEDVEPARTGEVDDERARLDRRFRGQQDLVDRAVGRGDDDQGRARARRPTRAWAATRGTRPPRSSTVRRARGRRRPTTVQPCSMSPSEMVVPARPGPIRARVRCPFLHGRLNVTAASMHAFPGRRGRDQVGGDVAQRRQNEPALPHPGVRHREIGIVDVRRRRTGAGRRRACAAPTARRAHAARRLRSRCASASNACGSQRRVDGDDRVEERVLRRTADGSGLVDARNRDAPRPRMPRASSSTANCRCAARSPRFEPSAMYARLTRSHGLDRIARRRHSPLDTHRDVVEQRADRRVHLADLDDRADHTRIGLAHLGDARREPFEQSVRSDDTTRLTASHTAE